MRRKCQASGLPDEIDPTLRRRNLPGFRRRVTYPQRLHSIATAARYFDWAARRRLVAFFAFLAACPRRDGPVFLMFERSVCVGRSRSVRYFRVASRASPRPLSSLLWPSRWPAVSCPTTTSPPRITMPPAYRAGPRHADAALPSIVWWRGFGSKELTDLIEEALTSNFDVAAAVARIVQADANSRVAGAALLPIVDLNASATRSAPRRPPAAAWSVPRRRRRRQRPVRAGDLQHVAQRQLRDRLLGQEPRRVARRRRTRGRQPVRSRGGGAHHRRQRRQRLFPGA